MSHNLKSFGLSLDSYFVTAGSQLSTWYNYGVLLLLPCTFFLPLPPLLLPPPLPSVYCSHHHHHHLLCLHCDWSLTRAYCHLPLFYANACHCLLAFYCKHFIFCPGLKFRTLSYLRKKGWLMQFLCCANGLYQNLLLHQYQVGNLFSNILSLPVSYECCQHGRCSFSDGTRWDINVFCLIFFFFFSQGGSLILVLVYIWRGMNLLSYSTSISWVFQTKWCQMQVWTPLNMMPCKSVCICAGWEMHLLNKILICPVSFVYFEIVISQLIPWSESFRVSMDMCWLWNGGLVLVFMVLL